MYELRLLKTLVTLTAALLAIIAGNVFRAVALFYLESGVFPMPPWAHDYTGLVAFALVAIGIVAAVQVIRREIMRRTVCLLKHLRTGGVDSSTSTAIKTFGGAIPRVAFSEWPTR